MIELQDIEFSYRKNATPALTGVTAVIEPGVHLLAGENGAGKTTLLHIIAGLATPQKGKCLINDNPSVTTKPSEMGRTFLIEENMEFPGKTIKGFARQHSQFYPNFSEDIFNENLQAFGMTGNEPLKTLSLGNRKKTQLAYALALGVDVLLLDEPTNALDIESKAKLRKMIAANISAHQTVIVSTHTISELEILFDGAMMLTRSHLLFAGTEEAVTKRLAFRVSRSPETDALYSEIQAGRVLNICPTGEDSETRVDWRLFYSALHSPQREIITKQLTR